MSDARIGKFDILSAIGAGGMADVYRCRLNGPGGFEKIVVVKRIRAERAADPSYVNMFLDEARLVARLNHPNIVQVFEIGEADGLPYIAMEYVKGPTLSSLMRAARRAGKVPLGHVARVMADVCEGLQHAHAALGPGGEPLGLVHRDVSPQNILVSREGPAKLLDFGVAKANGRLTDTLAGTLKGKLRYMAPEQLSGEVDHRADLFSAGVCLFEATTGQNPFGPPTLDEVALFQQIGAGKYRRPSELVPDYPAELEAIVLSAIAPDPARRCASARELQDRLERFASREPFQSGTRAVAEWVRQLFPDPDERAPQATPLAAGPPGRPRRSSPFNPLAAVLSPDTSASAGGPGGPAARPAPPVQPPHTPRRAAAAMAGALGTMVVAGVVWAVMQGTQSPPRPALVTSPGIAGAVPPLASDLLAGDAAQAYVEAAEKLTAGGQASTAADLLGKARMLAVKDPDLQRRMAELERQIAAAAATAALAGKPARRAQVISRRSHAERPAPPPELPPARRATPPKAAPAPPAPAPGTVAATPAPSPRGDIYSARPLPHVPPPDLPRSYRAQGAGDLEQMLRRVEQEAVRAGCSAPFSRGITDALYRALAAQRTPEIYPAGLYYLIVNEAAVGREKQSASQQLAVAHRSGLVKALRNLPVAHPKVN